MDLKDYFHIISKRKNLIAQSFLVIIIIVFIGSFIQRPVYEASIKVLIEPKIGRSTLLTGLAAGDALSALSRTGSPLNTQMEILKTNPVLIKVIEKLNLKDAKGRTLKPSSLRKKIIVSSIGLTDIIEISVQSNDPSKAAIIADMIGDVYVEETQQGNQREAGMARRFIENQLSEVKMELNGAEVGPGKGVNLLQGKRMVTVAEKTYLMLLEKLEEAKIAEAVKIGYARVIEPAAVPTSPVKPRKVFNAFIGAIFGIIFGMSLAFLFEYMDDSIKTEEEAKYLLNLPVLGMIPHFDEEEAKHGIRSGKNRGAKMDVEEYKRIYMQVLNTIKAKVKAYGSKIF